jgi:hypothetical protein
MKKIVMKQMSLLILSSLLSVEAMAASASDCSGYNHPNYEDEYRACLRLNLASEASASGVDCVECLFKQEEKGTSDWVQALSAVAQPLAYLGAAYVGAKYQYKSQQAWADAYEKANTQCSSQFSSYLDYTTSMGANAVTSSEASTLMNSCNSSSNSTYSGYAGLLGNSYGGYSNGYTSAGYSNGFMSGMIGSNYTSGLGYSGYGTGLGTSLYGGLSSSLYGNYGTSSNAYSGYGLYGNIGASYYPSTLNYASMGTGIYGSGTYSTGQGVNSNNMTCYYYPASCYGTSYYGASSGYNPYAVGNLSASLNISGGISGGYSF